MPFPGGIESTQNGTMLLSLAAAILYLFIAGAGPSLRRTAVKTASVALLAVLAFVSGAPLLLVAALALSALGDAALAQDGERPFMAGLGLFLAAHIAYAVLFVSVADGLAAVVVKPALLVLAAVLVLFALFLLVRLWQPVGDALRMPVAAYSAAILAMGLSALTVPSGMVVAGALLFVASDALLAWERFLAAPQDRRRAAAGPAVWVLYYAAQLLIVLGFLLS